MGGGLELEGAGVMGGTRDVLQEEDLATIGSVLRLWAAVLRRDFRSLLLCLPEITFPPRGSLILPPLFLGDCWELGWEEQMPACGAQAGCVKEKGSFTASRRDLPD